MFTVFILFFNSPGDTANYATTYSMPPMA